MFELFGEPGRAAEWKEQLRDLVPGGGEGEG
jgi:hypothetical protein